MLSTGRVTFDLCPALLRKTRQPLRFREMTANSENTHWLLRGRRGEEGLGQAELGCGRADEVGASGEITWTKAA